MAKGKTTPVMQQHAAAKLSYPDAILFFRLGDFYEMFGEDAVVCSRVLGLTLTSRNKGKPDEIPMAGVPHHAGHGYVGRLLQCGYKVAICDQTEDPKESRAKGKAIVNLISLAPNEKIRAIEARALLKIKCTIEVHTRIRDVAAITGMSEDAVTEIARSEGLVP